MLREIVSYMETGANILKSKFYFSSVAVFMLLCSCDCTCRIKGRVFNEYEEPVEGAVVSYEWEIDEGNVSTVETLEDGTFKIFITYGCGWEAEADVPPVDFAAEPGNVKIHVSKPGYISFDTEYVVLDSDGMGDFIEVVLEEDDISNINSQMYDAPEDF